MDGGELARNAAENAARGSYGKLVAILAGRTRDLALAEDALSEAFQAALAHWPGEGVPDNPEAWLLTVARRKSVDEGRRQRRLTATSDHLLLLADELASASNTNVPDERLGLMFACAHPAIDSAMHTPLILQCVLGFDAQTIASAFLVSPSSMSQRLVRAKGKIRKAGIPFHVPAQEEFRDRLEGVLEAIYAAYGEGWSDPGGSDIRRRNLAEDGIWLGRLVAAALPDEPEALGLVALMLHTEARRSARRGPLGEFVPLMEQDTNLWNAALIDEAEALLVRASQMNAIGRYQLEAAIQSAHAARRLSGATNWRAILALYDVLWRMTSSPVVAINRAIALAEVDGPEEGLAALECPASELSGYQPYWAARAELLSRLNRPGADEAFQQAIGLETDPAIRQFLQRKLARLIS
jgi:RNA polymerase sigma-70 factor, ECF subfamily